MNGQRDVDTIIATWLDEGPVDLPADTRRAIVVGLRTQPRARQVAILRGLPMSSIARFAAAAAIVLAVGGLSVYVLSNRGSGPGALPSASASATPLPSPPASVAPSASLVSTADWVAFTSDRYGYSIAHPPTWTAESATRDWVYATDRLDITTPAADGFIDKSASYQINLTAFAVDVPAGTSEDEWITAYYLSDPDPTCRVTLDALVPTTVDGHPGRIGNGSCSDSQAFVFVDGRVHVFAIWRGDQEPLLDAFLSTVRFDLTSPGGSATP